MYIFKNISSFKPAHSSSLWQLQLCTLSAVTMKTKITFINYNFIIFCPHNLKRVIEKNPYYFTYKKLSLCRMYTAL